MKTATITCSACFVLALLVFCQNATATLISVSEASFGAGTLHETFSEQLLDLNGNLINPSNTALSPDESKNGSMVLIGTTTSYTFSQTGVVFTSPVPNTYANYHPEISVVKGNQYFNFGTYGELLPGSGLIPGGTGAKFLLEVGSSSSHFSPFILTFPGEGATKVGGNFIMSGQTPSLDRIIVTAYGATGNLLGTSSISACNVSNWSNNFLGIATSDGTPIKSIGIDYSTNNNAGNPGIANLMFVPDLAPEPGTAILLALAGLSGGLFLLRRKFHRQS